jgi:hypothetical protein
LGSFYGGGDVLTLLWSGGAGCYKILNWNTGGTETIFGVTVMGTNGGCGQCLERTFSATCPKTKQCCVYWEGFTDFDIQITGYGCDGTWYYNYTVTKGTQTPCMSVIVSAQTYGQLVSIKTCCFNIQNLSLTESITVNYSPCDGDGGTEVIAPNSTSTTCYHCADTFGNSNWNYVPC